MYVEFASGTAYPDGYIAPCEVIKEIPGWAYVVLSAMEPYQRHTWAQWVRKSHLLSDSEVTNTSFTETPE